MYHSSGFINRDLLITILLGFVVGLIFAYGVWTAQQSLKNPQQIISPQPTVSQASDSSDLASPTATEGEPTQASSNDNLFAVSYPYQYLLTDQKKLTIKGRANQSATVLVIAESGQATALPDKDNDFEVDVNLITGINNLSVFAVWPDGTTKRQDFQVILSATPLEES